MESVGSRQAIGTARFGQKAKFGVARHNMFARTEALTKTQTLSPSFEKIVDARNLAAAQERRLYTTSSLVGKSLVFSSDL